MLGRPLPELGREFLDALGVLGSTSRTDTTPAQRFESLLLSAAA